MVKCWEKVQNRKLKSKSKIESQKKDMFAEAERFFFMSIQVFIGPIEAEFPEQTGMNTRFKVEENTTGTWVRSLGHFQSSKAWTSENIQPVAFKQILGVVTIHSCKVGDLIRMCRIWTDGIVFSEHSQG